MEELLENLKEALKENPDLILEIPVKMERVSEEEMSSLFIEVKSENNEVIDDLS